MNNILALDSSTDACSVALSIDGVLTSRFEIATQSHTQRLLPMVEELLAEQQLALADLDALAFSRGPGSFTGLRICIGIIQGLAYGANLPVIPVSTLEAMAMGFYRANRSMNVPLLVALDARMDEVYWSLYQRGDDGYPQSITGEFVMRPEDIAQQLSDLNMPAITEASIAGIGSGWRYPAMPSSLARQLELAVNPHAENILSLALPRLIAGQVESIENAQPVYLRDSISWQKRQRIRAQPILDDNPE